MNMRPLFVIGAAAAIVVVSMAASQQQPAAKKTVFSTLKVGQSVILKDKATAFEISTLDVDDVGTHKITEIAADFIVVKDIANIAESRIPIYSIRAVVHVTTKQK